MGHIYHEQKTHAAWLGFIAGGRNKVSRTVANNTTARVMSEGMVAIKLHDTDIVTVFNDGRMILNSGGWLSSTTKERINRYSNAGISQKNSIWYMRDGSLFYDGMVIDVDGTPQKPQMPAKYEAKLKLIKRDAKVYAKAFVAELQAGNVPMPSGEDCWYCAMFDRDAVGGNVEHIREHLREKYYVPSLLVNAGRAAGYRDDQIGMMGIGGRRLFIDPERNIYKFVVRKLQGAL
jgi:hypothetical protein